MLGDAGANALGAVLGTAAAAGLSRRGRIAVLAGITGLTAASEVVSFTKVIQRTPLLHWLDMLGRRPAHAAPHPGPGPGSASRAPGPLTAARARPATMLRPRGRRRLRSRPSPGRTLPPAKTPSPTQ